LQLIAVSSLIAILQANGLRPSKHPPSVGHYGAVGLTKMFWNSPIIDEDGVSVKSRRS